MYKMNKFVNFMRDYVFARSVIPIGIIVIAIGIYASTIYGDRKYYPRCEATVTDSELLRGSYGSEDNPDSRVYRNYIKYTVDGQEYECELNFSSSSMKNGDRLELLYDPAHPYKIKPAGTMAFFLCSLFEFMGIVFIAVSYFVSRLSRRT